MGFFVPADLETEASIDEIFEKYSQGHRYGIFTILNFDMPDESTARIEFRDVACMSGGGAALAYEVRDDAVAYSKVISSMRS